MSCRREKDSEAAGRVLPDPLEATFGLVYIVVGLRSTTILQELNLVMVCMHTKVED